LPGYLTWNPANGHYGQSERFIMTQCVLLDGLPGSGKSTTAHLLSRHLQAQGATTNWFFEHDTSHPIFEHERIIHYMTTGDFDASLFDEAPKKWRAMCDTRAETDDITILESSFFQSPIHVLLLNGTGLREIMSYVMSCAVVIEPLRPRLVYLGLPDPAIALERACTCRGDWFAPFLEQVLERSEWGRTSSLDGQEAVLAYFADYIQTVDELVARLPFPTCVIDISDGNHERINQLLCQFLELPAMDSSIPPTHSPERFAGRYLARKSGEEFTVFVEEGVLRAHGPSSAAMIPLSGTVFEILGLNVRITFDEPDDEGIYQLARFEGNLPGLEAEWQRITDDAVRT